MADLTQLESALVKADAAGDEEGARILATEIRRMRGIGQDKPAFSPEQISAHAQKAGISSFRGERPVQAGLSDFLSGMTGLTRGAVKLVSPEVGKALEITGARPDTAASIAGSVVDPVAWGVGGGVAKVLPYAPVLGRGIAKGATALGRNIAGGAAAGGTIGGLSEEGTTTGGAAIGGGLAVALPPVASGIGKGVGKLWDLLSGSLPTVKAAQILRDVVGPKLDAIKAAITSAPDDLTAAQAAANVGSDAWSALGQLSATQRSQFFTELLAKQSQERVEPIRRMARGATQTEVKQATEASQKALRNITTPMRETELAAANEAGTTGVRLQSEADRLGAAASSKVEDVRRLEAAKQIATDVAGEGNLTIGRPTTSEQQVAAGMPRLQGQIGRYGYGTELANRAEGASQQAADASLMFGDAARFAQSRANSLEAHNLRPLDTGRVVGNIVKKLNDPSIGVDPINHRVLTNVAKTISEWTAKGGGTIDAAALYEIRKSAINGEVMKLLGTADPKANAKYAARLLSEIKPAIDDAIEAAGGTGWRDYLRTFESGMHQINQQQMAGKALQLLETTPKKFESLVAGNEPKMVEKVFKTDYDIKAAMGDKMVPLQKAAEELSRDRRISEGAARGAGQLEEVLAKNISKFKLPNWINAKIAVTNRGLIELESRVNRKTMEQVYEAMRTGQKASKLLGMLPASERMPVIKALMTQSVTPYVAGAATNVAEQ